MRVHVSHTLLGVVNAHLIAAVQLDDLPWFWMFVVACRLDV